MLKYCFRLSLVVIILIADFGFLNEKEPPTKHKAILPPPFLVDKKSEWVDSVFKSLTLEEQIAQLVMVAAYSNMGGVDGEHAKSISELIEKYNIGGLIFMKGGPMRQALLTNHFQDIAKTPLMIAIDGEWGLSMRLDSTIVFPKQMMLGAIKEDVLIYDMGTEIARQCKRMGIQVNFAPVVDVNNNPNNPVINYRSFGEDKYNVAQKSLQYMAGMQEHNILTTAKHFPGHGDTDTDSHLDLPLINHNKKRLDTLELYPFDYLIRRGLGGIMIAHLNIPALDRTKNRPSTLSPLIVDRLLKKKMNFNGLIFTDALNMQGVAKYYKPGEIEVQALIAGNDVLLFPQDVPKAIEKIKEAVENGTIKKNVIEKRCKKILLSKQWLGLDTLKPIDTTNLIADLNTPKALALRKELIKNAITIVKSKQDIIPFKNIDTLTFASIAIGEAVENTFQKYLKYYTDVVDIQTHQNLSELEYKRIFEKIGSRNTVIISIHNTNNSPAKHYGISDNTVEFIKQISTKKRVILCLFSNPYSLQFFKDIHTLEGICMSYEDNETTQEITAQAIFGALPVDGMLPVSSGNFHSGTSISFPSYKRLRYCSPEEVGLSSEKLKIIDSIANNAIDEDATPGCQILIARKGAVVFNKGYGYHSYQKLQKVKPTDLYDIASITKITATILTLMKLQDEGLFSIDTTLGYYLPELDSTNKDTLQIRDILTHQAQLKPWIPFYLSLIQNYDDPDTQIVSRIRSWRYSIPLDVNLFLDRDYSFRDSILSHTETDTFSVHVAQNLYMNKSFVDSIYRRIDESELRPIKAYKYSDLGYYYLRKIIENITHTSINKYVDSVFYNPIGASTLGYLPLKRFSPDRIIPTEYDKIFRKQILKGYVHDPGAAMLGCVGGHAGLFSNANDLAKIMQLYLNGGYYAGKQYIQKETLDLFTSCPYYDNNNRRGLGFDKRDPDTTKVLSVPKNISLKSYGHSGFTGCITWVDPDEEIIYIFLSNRIHPDALNKKIYKLDVRPAIHQAIYDAIIDKTQAM